LARQYSEDASVKSNGGGPRLDLREDRSIARSGQAPSRCRSRATSANPF
jgi:hypothetical protein